MTFLRHLKVGRDPGPDVPISVYTCGATAAARHSHGHDTIAYRDDAKCTPEAKGHRLARARAKLSSTSFVFAIFVPTQALTFCGRSAFATPFFLVIFLFGVDGPEL